MTASTATAWDAARAGAPSTVTPPASIAALAREVVDEQRQKLAEAEAGKARLQAALTRLDAVG